MHKGLKIRLVILVPLLIAAGCNRPVADLFPEDPELRRVSVWVVSHGWHVGIVLPNNHIFRDAMPPNYHGLDYRFNEFGWGDRAYYMTENPGFWTTLKGGLWPTPSVVHAAAFDRSVESQFSRLTMVEIYLSEKGFEALCEALSADIKLDSDGYAVILESGWYANSRFYSSPRRYFLPRTSNKWVARLLREAGAPITPFYALTSGNVIQQSRRFGDVTWKDDQ